MSSRWGLAQRLAVAGLSALALLALGEQAPAAFPVHVSIEAHSATLVVTVDGQTHALSSALGGGWQTLMLQQPGPLQREYQIDGSDTTSTNDREADVVQGLLDTPLYRLDAFLRDEDSYSRWEGLRMVDLASGADVAPGDALPTDFRVDVNLRRPEGLARVWLVVGPDRREGLELDRDLRNARWLIQRGQGTDALPRWFFPEQPAPFAASLLQLLGRSAMAGFALALAALGLARLARRVHAFATGRPSTGGSDAARTGATGSPSTGGSDAARWGASGGPPPECNEPTSAFATGSPSAARVYAARGGATGSPYAGGADAAGAGAVGGERVGGSASGRGDVAGAGVLGGQYAFGGAHVRRRDFVVGGAALGVWLAVAAAVSARAYHQLPHILDAVSYTFQAGLFATGQLSLAAPPHTDAFKGPFEVLWQGRLFSQYPPGAPAVYGLGSAVHLEWLVGPLACAVLIGAMAYTARTLYGQATAVALLVLGVLSPFILFQAGSYLSHPVSGGLLAAALAAFVTGEKTGKGRWYAACGALLGAAFVAREIASVLFALPLGIRLLQKRRWYPITHVVAFGVPFVLAYLLYNLRQTGSPLLLPRTIFDPSDHFGFGSGIGFHTRHTLAAGLANTDELLTLLQFDAFGWPPLFLFGLMGIPFLLRKARDWDVLAAVGLLAFVVAYVAYFYHGIALGPRYYFEAMPWVLLLSARGVQTLARLARGWLAPAVLVGGLCLNTVFFYVPAELQRRLDMSGLPGGLPLRLDFVHATAFGPQLVDVPPRSLVVTGDWWLYNAALAPLNCPQLPACEVLFALAPTDQDVAQLQSQFPDRTLVRAVEMGGHVQLALGAL